MADRKMRRWGIRAVVALALAGAAWLVWQGLQPDGPAALVSGKGRIEATEIDIATKSPGRIAGIFVNEGDVVTAGQVVARMDTRGLQAELRQTKARLGQARGAVATARSQLAQAESEMAEAEAALVQRKAEYDAARRLAERSAELAKKGAVSGQVADKDRARMLSAQAGVKAAQAQIAAARAAIVTARSRIDSAASDVEAVAAGIGRIHTELEGSELVAPRDGRVHHVVARAGEALAVGGRVLSLVDLTDVYVTFSLPAEVAGRVAIGSEVRLVLDAAPRYAIPARVAFVSDLGQFTPRAAATQDERETPMFRVRARIAPELLRRHRGQIETGLPGVAWVRLDPQQPWPPELRQNLMK